MILFITATIALIITAFVAAYARHSYSGIVISRLGALVLFLGAFIVINESARTLFSGVDQATFILVGIGLLVEVYGAQMMIKDASK